MKKITILEPGAWGTALGIILSKEYKIVFWYKSSSLALRIKKAGENDRLPGIKIPKEVNISSDLKKTIKDACLAVVASPSFSFRKTINALKRIKNLPPILGIAKGIEKESLKLPSQVLEEVLGNIPYAHLSGPGFAKEVARGKRTKEVLASKDEALLRRLKKAFQIKPFSIFTTTDLIGVELAGTLKNALAIGISLVEASLTGAKLDRIKKKLIYYALEEMIELGQAMGARKETFLGPAGIDDLILTATNPLSRNFQFGKRLLHDSKKMREEIKQRKITVEGFNNICALHRLAKIYKLNLPMIEEIYKVIYKKIYPKRTVKNLISLVE